MHCQNNGKYAFEYFKVYIAKVMESMLSNTSKYTLPKQWKAEAYIAKVLQRMLSKSSKYAVPKVCFRKRQSIHCQSDGKSAFEYSK